MTKRAGELINHNFRAHQSTQLGVTRFTFIKTTRFIPHLLLLCLHALLWV